MCRSSFWMDAICFIWVWHDRGPTIWVWRIILTKSLGSAWANTFVAWQVPTNWITENRSLHPSSITSHHTLCFDVHRLIRMNLFIAVRIYRSYIYIYIYIPCMPSLVNPAPATAWLHFHSVTPRQKTHSTILAAGTVFMFVWHDQVCAL